MRQTPTIRIRTILAAALHLARRHGYLHITRAMIAERARCSASLISAHMGDMMQVRRALLREAVRVEDWHVVAQGIVARDPVVARLPVTVRRKALEKGAA
jgi:AcrR family transcriptional regulator